MDTIEKKALYHTFGCKLNFAETSTLARALEARGYKRCQAGEEPDVIVVNTCSVTETADRKCRQEIRSLHRRHPAAAIVVTGCYAQLKSSEVARLDGVAIVAGNNSKLSIPDMLEQWEQQRQPLCHVPPAQSFGTGEFQPSCSRGDRTRFFLKVQDGCDYWCTYCTIPKARGRSRSGEIADLVAQARQAAAEGAKEIVITGVNIGDFGKGRDDTFFDLIQALDAVEGIERYRISSIEPNLLTDEIIDWCAGARAFMPHFHIPLQCGSDQVLKLMHRRYDTALFRHKIERIRQVMPDAFIGVDIIAGARGETAALFDESAAFAGSLDISRLHVFPYSERPGTRALELEGAVPQAEKNRRAQALIAISDDKQAEFTRRFEGSVRPVLLEHGEADGSMSGFTDNYLRVRVENAAGLLKPNTIAWARLHSFDPETMELRGTAE